MEEVLVDGSGPVGLITAIGLARQGLQVRLGPVAKGEADKRLLDTCSVALRKVFLAASSPISCETKRRTFHLTAGEFEAARERPIAAQETGWGSGARTYHAFQIADLGSQS